jgi:hypothetical protein
VCALGPSEQAAIGIRYDEEDDAAAESFVVKLTPGKAEIQAQLPGAAPAIAATPSSPNASGAVFVLDAKGVVHVGGRKHRLAQPRALVSVGDKVALAASDRVWLLGSDGVEVAPGPKVIARRLASSPSGTLLLATDEGALLVSDASGEREVEVPSGGHMSALALDDNGRVVASSGKTLLVGDTKKVAPVATAPFEIHCVAMHAGRAMLSSRAHGLFAYDALLKKVVPVKPSLRAHTLSVKDGVLVAASDLFVATYDGRWAEDEVVEFLTRDLAPFVRLAEQHLPRFLSSEDPGTI